MENKPVITFDFDECLAFEECSSNGWIMVGSGTLAPVKEIIDMVFEKDKEGFECHIVTFRNEWGIEGVHQFVTHYNLPIKIEHIHRTSGSPKTPVLKRLNSQLHVDDNIEVCILAEQAGIKALLVDWGWNTDENSSAELLDKIKISKSVFFDKEEA